MYTYQDYLEYKAAGKLSEFVGMLITKHKGSAEYRTAVIADAYDAERNTTILQFARTIFTARGVQIQDETHSNMRLTSAFFPRLNTQRCTYSLGNGLTFSDENTAKKLGFGADKTIKDAGYYGLIHGVSFLYWSYDRLKMFKLTEFAPLYDEMTGELSAGVRFWQIASNKPLYATLYEPDGYLDFKSADGGTAEFKPLADEMQAYRMTVATTPATTGEQITANNYGVLPIVPLYGTRLHQSTLVGMRSKIDAYDMVLSGFANDLQDCAQIYWIISGAGGVTDKELSKFRERLLYRHIAEVDGDSVTITPHTQEIPHEARTALLSQLRGQIYEDFGGIDVHTISAGATNDHIDAAYQPLDEDADDFEYQVIEAVRGLLALQGVDAEAATPQFKRNRVSNQKEQVEMVMMEAPYLDEETILKKLPNVSEEEVPRILVKRTEEDGDRFGTGVSGDAA